MSGARVMGLFVATALAWRLVACGGLANDGATGSVPTNDAGADEPLPPPITPEAQSGHRLRAVYWSLDGAQESVIEPINGYANGGAVFYDTQLGEECAFTGRLDGAGRDYCLPLATITEEPVPSYADSGCTLKLVHTTTSCGTSGVPRFIVDTDTICLRPIAVRRVGALFARQSVVYYRDASTGLCLLNAWGADDTFYRYGDEIPLTGFVSAQEVPSAATSSAIVPLDLVADDGARQRLLGWSTANKMPYTVDFSPDGTTPLGWAPARIATGSGTFGDSACTQPVAHANLFLCPPTAAGTSLTDADPSALGATVTSALYTQGANATCVPAMPPNDGAWYAVGAPLSSAVLPSSFVETGTGRLHPLHAATPDGVALGPFPASYFPQYLLDTATHERCVLTVVAGSNDVATCIPVEDDGELVSTDSGCRMPAVLFRNRDPSVAIPTSYNTSVASACGDAPPVVRSVGAKITPAAVYHGDYTTCTVGIGDSGILPGDEIYALGDVIPISAFATATRMRE